MNYLRYLKFNPIKNGTTTIIKQNAYIKAGSDLVIQADKTARAISKFAKGEDDMYWEDYKNKGVAKVDPKDIYDEKKGLAVAGIKAEMAAQKNFQAEVYAAIKETEKLQKILEKALADSEVIVKDLTERLENN